MDIVVVLQQMLYSEKNFLKIGIETNFGHLQVQLTVIPNKGVGQKVATDN